MSDRGYMIRDQHAVHFITFAVVEWIDVFSRKEYADILVDSLKFCQLNKGLRIHAWCIMSLSFALTGLVCRDPNVFIRYNLYIITKALRINA